METTSPPGVSRGAGQAGKARSRPQRPRPRAPERARLDFSRASRILELALRSRDLPCAIRVSTSPLSPGFIPFRPISASRKRKPCSRTLGTTVCGYVLQNLEGRTLLSRSCFWSKGLKI